MLNNSIRGSSLLTIALCVFALSSVLHAEKYVVLDPDDSDHLHDSDHFVVRWNDADSVEITDEKIEEGLETLESIWDFYTGEVGFPAPYTEDNRKYKVDINLSNKGWATGSGTGIKHPEMWLHFNAFQDPHALAHEFAHCLQFSSMGLRDSPYVGWVWESHAEWMVHQMTPDNIGCSSMLVNSPHLYYGSTRNRYCNWQFWEYIKDQHGYQAINTMWMQAKRQDDKAHKVESPLGVLARNMKWETSDLNDAFGDWAMRNVTWDYSNGAVYREKYGSYANKKGDRRNRVSILNTVDARDGEYVIPSYRAPQRYGYNLVRLEIDTDNRFQRIRVRFRGLVQSEPEVRRFKQNFEKEPETVPDPASDWRWGIVGVLKNGSPYYSPLQRGKSADLAFNIRRNTEAVWLVVTATPSEYHSIEWDQIYYSIYRYPWMVQIDGARPAPKNEGKAYSRKNGKRHANGGGWVASGAEVDRSAYVGPEAMVLGSAKVLGDARIEDRAVVSGQAVVSDQAIIREDAFIGGKSIVNGKALVEDEATVYAGSVSENAQVGALTILEGEGTKITGNARVYAVMNAIRDKEISGDAHLIGDIELHTTLSQGVFYGIITPEMSQDPRWGSERKAPEREVTKPFSSNWDNAER